MAFTFVKAQGGKVGSSLVEEDKATLKDAFILKTNINYLDIELLYT